MMHGTMNVKFVDNIWIVIGNENVLQTSTELNKKIKFKT